jgi:flagellar basal-body rod modification protein FlgD
MTTSSVTSALSPTVTSPTTASSTLSKDDFLKLLITQMQNQDPLSPMDGTQYAAQLAQFSSLEQLTNLNDVTTQGVNANLILAQSINNGLSASFIGKDAQALTDTFKYDGSTDVKMGYTLSSTADTATVTVYNEAGQAVKNLQRGTENGDNTVTWDGTNENGAAVEEGKYTFKVEAKDSNGNTLSSNQFVYGKIQSVRFTSNGAAFMINGIDVPLSNILEILGS